MRIASLVVGILLVGTGIWCFTNSGFTFLSFAFILGCMVFLSGLCHIVAFFLEKKRLFKEEWRLAEGLWSTFFGILILSDLLITDEIAVVCFGMWILNSGINRAIVAMAQWKEKKNGWHFTAAFAAASILAGLFAFLNPLVGGFGMVAIIGIAFLFQGANMIVIAVQMKKILGNAQKESLT